MTVHTGRSIPAGSRTPRRGGLVPLAATLLVGAVAALLDTTVVAVALDGIGRDLHAPVAAIGWVTTGYVLAMAAVIPLVGWSVGRFGARAMWLAALGGFLAGSLLCATAWSVGSLVAFRVVQGVGGGMILPLTQLTLARAAGPHRLGQMMAAVGLVGQIAPVSGPVLGGVLVDGPGWRWIFLVNVPVVLVSAAMTLRWFPRDVTERTDRRLDTVGLALLPAGVVALLYALSTVASGPGSARPGTVALAVAGAALLAAFAVRSVRRGGGALVDLRLFADRSFRAGAVLMLVTGATTWGPMFLLPLYYQRVRELSALDAGLALAPQNVGLAVAFLLLGRHADRLPPRPLAAAGFAVATVATVPFALADAGSDPWLLDAALLLRGFGFGAATLPVSIALYRTLRPVSIPDATTAGNVVQRVGAATGTALMAAVLQADGFTPALVWMFGLTAAGLTATVLLPGRSPPSSTPPP